MADRTAIPITRRIEGLPIIVVFVLLLGLFMVTAPQVFLAPFIYTTFLSTLPPLILLAVGLTFVIGSGEIDLSFPAIIGFAGFVFAVLFKEYELGWIVRARRTSRGHHGRLSERLADRQGRHPVLHHHPRNPVPLVRHGHGPFRRQVLRPSRRRPNRPFGWLSLAGRWPASTGPPWLWQIPMQALWTVAIVVFLWFILNRHRFGEHALFIGDSNDVSRVVGIDVDREKIKIFTLMGLLAALAAIMLTLENKNYFGNQGQGYLLTAIASVLIGGTSIFGGRATIIGTVFGCLIIGMIEAGLVASGLTGAWVRTIQGLVFPVRHYLLSLSRRAAKARGVLRTLPQIGGRRTKARRRFHHPRGGLTMNEKNTEGRFGRRRQYWQVLPAPPPRPPRRRLRARGW